MEFRKVELQRQMAEALKLDEKELFSLLKGQWAHRFGVDSLPSLEEIKTLNVGDQSDQEQIKGEIPQVMNLSKDQPLIKVTDSNLGTPKSTVDTKEIENLDNKLNEDRKLPEVTQVSPSNEYNENLFTNSQVRKNIKVNEVPKLIPIPPLPNYSYLKKWIYG